MMGPGTRVRNHCAVCEAGKTLDWKVSSYHFWSLVCGRGLFLLRPLQLRVLGQRWAFLNLYGKELRR